MKRLILTVASLAAADPACAQSIALKPLMEMRFRYEHVDQDDLPRDAAALTLRLRGGVEAKAGRLSAILEGQGTLAVTDHYYDGLHGPQRQPLVADPKNVALYRAQVHWQGDGVALTVGRQRIALDDERFVGAIQFRDNGQTFDAVRAEVMPFRGLKADVSYAWSQRTIWGVDGKGARQQAVSGTNILANLSYQTSLGTFTGFAYLIDQDEAAVQSYRLSSQTYGGRFAGAYAFSKAVRMSYQASFARQSDYRRNPNDYRADYYLIDAGFDVHRVKLGGGYEVLGADRGAALASFQTPLATAFKFQGWADKFLTTPPDGVRDLYGSAGYGLKTRSRLGTVLLQGVYHRFHSDRLVRNYGNEIDLIASAKVGRTALSVRYAHYEADRLAADADKLWLQADWAL